MDMSLGHTRLIIDVARREGLLRNQLAYVLATAYWETNKTMKPVREAYWLSEDWRRRNLRYYPWYGRGFVQLTWQANYLKAGKALDRDFITDPDAVMEPDASAEILVVGSKEGWFTGKKLSDYITLQRSDFRNARRIINLMDKADTIAGMARRYDDALKADGYGEEAPQSIPAATPQPDPKPAPAAELEPKTGFLRWLWRFLFGGQSNAQP